MSIVALIISFATGILMGMFGSGGSILIIPILVHLAGLDPRTATTASLVVVGLTSLIACVQHAISGGVRMKVAGAFALAGIPGAYIGSRAMGTLSPTMLMLFFACFMIVMALLMLRQRRFEPAPEPSPAKIIPIGLGIGVLTGVIGVGGGLLVVPSLLVFGGVTMADAIGTSLVIITINCVSGLRGRLPGSNTIPWDITLGYALAAVAGTFIGHAIAKRMSVAGLHRSFAIFVLVVGLFELANNLPV